MVERYGRLDVERTAVAEPVAGRELDLRTAASLPVAEVLARLDSREQGLGVDEAVRRLAAVGPNALQVHTTSAWRVLWNQVRNPLLPLLVGAAIVSGLTGQVTDAGIIVVMVGVSVGLGFANEFRSEKAVEELHAQIRHTTTAIRHGRSGTVDVTELVPGDVVRLSVGDIVPADVRLIEVDRLECDEAVLTGESLPAVKQVDLVAEPTSPIELPPARSWVRS